MGDLEIMRCEKSLKTWGGDRHNNKQGKKLLQRGKK